VVFFFQIIVQPDFDYPISFDVHSSGVDYPIWIDNELFAVHELSQNTDTFEITGFLLRLAASKGYLDRIVEYYFIFLYHARFSTSTLPKAFAL